MCYVGGPRCSESAIRRLKDAKKKYKDSPTADNLEARKNAYQEYLLTPAGLEHLETWQKQLAEAGEDEQADAISLLLEKNQAQRERMLKNNRRRDAMKKLAWEGAEEFENRKQVAKILARESAFMPSPTRTEIRDLADDLKYKGYLPNLTGSEYYVMKNLKARCKQIELIDSLNGQKLSPPGSQIDSYPRDENGDIAEVYYASYGSNVNPDRLKHYIQGGRPKGSTRDYKGCTDKTLPQDDVAVKLPYPLMFALHSKAWNGGIGFIDRRGEGESLGRAYQVTASQFHQIFEQESNSFFPDNEEISIDYLVSKGQHRFTNKAYGMAVHVGDYNGRPVVTFTNPGTIQDALSGRRRIKSVVDPSKKITFRVNKASPAYLRMIGEGLKDTYDLNLEQQITYFKAAPGCQDLKESEIRQALSSLYPTSTKGKGYTWTGSGYQSSTSSRTSGSSSKGRGTTAPTPPNTNKVTFSSSTAPKPKAPEPQLPLGINDKDDEDLTYDQWQAMLAAEMTETHKKNKNK